MDSTDLQEAPAEDTSAPVPPQITSRFLFVDIAAMRAKQLRRGALSRLRQDDAEGSWRDLHKAERIAMEEVRRGLVQYEVPEAPRPGGEL
jgi:DNA-directed RNA polymerase subunit K/omega